MQVAPAATGELKVHIYYEMQDGPFGGGNQFLKALRQALIDRDRYEEDPARADVIVFNSHRYGQHDRLGGLVELKRRHPEKVVVHRVDGPMALTRADGGALDRSVFLLNATVADGTVFQSNWSRERSVELGYADSLPWTRILNAPDPNLVYRPAERPSSEGRRLRVVGTSWSTNPNKGFDDYAYLARSLDPERFEMNFVGRSPMPLDPCEIIPPCETAKLAEILRGCDIFVFAGRNDACSNSLIEAMHSGLPALAIDDGGNPEIVGSGGELYREKEEMPALIERIAADLPRYRQAIDLPDLSDVAEQYLAFADRLFAERDDRPHTVSALQALRLRVAGEWAPQWAESWHAQRRRLRNKWRRLVDGYV